MARGIDIKLRTSSIIKLIMGKEASDFPHANAAPNGTNFSLANDDVWFRRNLRW